MERIKSEVVSLRMDPELREAVKAVIENMPSDLYGGRVYESEQHFIHIAVSKMLASYDRFIPSNLRKACWYNGRK